MCFVDYGTVDFQRLSQCRYLRRKWSQIPGQAIEAHLHGVLPAEGRKKFTNENRDMILKLTSLPVGTLYACVRLDYFDITSFRVATNILMLSGQH